MLPFSKVVAKSKAMNVVIRDRFYSTIFGNFLKHGCIFVNRVYYYRWPRRELFW